MSPALEPCSSYVYRVGHDRIYTPYKTIYLVISLPKVPYIHRIYMVLANPACLPWQLLHYVMQEKLASRQVRCLLSRSALQREMTEGTLLQRRYTKSTSVVDVFWSHTLSRLLLKVGDMLYTMLSMQWKIWRVLVTSTVCYRPLNLTLHNCRTGRKACLFCKLTGSDVLLESSSFLSSTCRCCFM